MKDFLLGYPEGRPAAAPGTDVAPGDVETTEPPSHPDVARAPTPEVPPVPTTPTTPTTPSPGGPDTVPGPLPEPAPEPLPDTTSTPRTV